MKRTRAWGVRCRSTSVFAFLVLGAAFASPVYPQQWEYDARTFYLLPPYCKHTHIYRNVVPGGRNPLEIERWKKLMGPDFEHIHHYCRGLEHTNRALYFERTQQSRNLLLKYSISEFDYVLRNAHQDFAMRPEILTKKAENLLQLGDTESAVLAIDDAVKLHPTYWPPYAALSDHYHRLGQIQKAREWLKKGLAAAPNTRALERRLEKLDQRK